jgi:2-oxoglutarate dehydrogenase E1 component
MSTFGLNSAYISELYYEFLKNPNAFGEEWQVFFAKYDPSSDESEDLALPPTGAATVAAAPASQNGSEQSGANGSEPRTPSAPSANPAPPAATPSAPVEQKPAAAAKPAGPLPEGARQISGAPLRLAQNMEQSLGVPTATSFREIPVKLLEENRTLINGYLKASDQGKTSFTHIIGWAIVKAAMQFPSLNNGFQTIEGKSYLIERGDVNLGLAIDLERPGGGRSLVVPNIKGANRMTFLEFFNAYEAMVAKARAGKLGPDDFAGTSITLTNPGTIGTVASVPRLMAGQGTIIATGGINYPAAYIGMDAETLSELGVSKVMQLTSTYDHRIIQGAESGMFLAKIQAYITGEEGFYDEIFRSLRIPYRPLGWERDRNPSVFSPDRTEAIRKQQRVLQLINAFRVRGHRQAHLDPLGYDPVYFSDLDPSAYGLTIWDLDRTFMTGGNGLAGKDRANLRTILSILRDTYTQRIGVEYMHIQEREVKYWLRDRMETSRNCPSFTTERKRRILKKLSESEVFEKFLQTKYTGHKRFSLEGAETMIPMFDELTRSASAAGMKEVIIGMAHRGRLNMLGTVLGKSPQKIFAEFEDIHDHTSFLGSGDVKYHLGEKGTIVMDDGSRLNIWLAPNPSHLEAVDPVIEGMTRARQDRAGASGEEEYLPVQIHGDAAFAGQGVVAEVLNMSQLEGYRTGGTVHIVINNQIGFTASPEDTRSGIYATDIAKMVQAPIFHVNGDDPEAAVYVTALAFEFRQKYKRDVVIDLYCYRRFGHNETDEPMYTQPILYHKIRQHPSTRVVYTARLLRNGTLTVEEVERMEGEFKEKLEKLLAATKAQGKIDGPADPLADQLINPVHTWTNPSTGVPEFMLDHIVGVLSSIPEGVNAHPKLAKTVQARSAQFAAGKIDWALAESISMGSLLLEGFPVRLSGQDSQRGTFSQRHAVLHDQTSGECFTHLNHLSETQAKLAVYDSPLSEFGVLGFEYGYSVADPETLVLWEAQFGDFVNGAQIIIDQFISSGEDKWGQTSGVVLLLPHGFEGQGPEHSSARLERFLTLCAEDNMQVCTPTTPAQYFHLLRRQVKREVRKPLIVMTPKSLLRDPMVVSRPDELTTGNFLTVIPEHEQLDPAAVTRVVVCSGKIYYDLLRARVEAGTKDVAIVRIEQLYPFPSAEVSAELQRFSNAKEVIWVQEEPKNMGSWPTVSHWIYYSLGSGQMISFLGRPASGSPAAGSGGQHLREQKEIVRRALKLNGDEEIKTNAPATGSRLPEA